jgi:hypothetical protein
MAKNFYPNIPNLIVMIRPKSFGYNSETAASNSFQNSSNETGVSQKAQLEFDKMVAILQAKKIHVKVFEDIVADLPDSVFPNNWFSHIPNGPIVIYPMYTPNRRKEVRFDVISDLQKELGVFNVIDLSKKTDAGLFLEGTGSIVFDHEYKIAYACQSPRTNQLLLNELCARIGYKSIVFESVDQRGMQIYHTNVMMSVGEKLVVICTESIKDKNDRDRVLEAIHLSNKSSLNISYEQMNSFGGNALEVQAEDGKVYYLFSKNATDALSNEQLSQLNEFSEVLSFEIPTIETIGGGSVRCMLAGLFA